MKERNGKRKMRSSMVFSRMPTLGYYCIVTDAEETEKNYLEGFKNSLPSQYQDKLVLKVIPAQKLDHLVDEALRQKNLHPQYCEPWIVFDKDLVKNFDEIIQNAIDNDVKVGWSNPCIEIWLHAYYGSMPNYSDSVSCWKGFAATYETKTQHEYDKADKTIYHRLNESGNEKKAIQIAQQRYNQHFRDGNTTPSQMSSTTTVHLLIDEIRKKTSESD